MSLIIWQREQKNTLLGFSWSFRMTWRLHNLQIKSLTCSFTQLFVCCWSYIRDVQWSRRKVRSFKSMSKVASVTGESIPISSFHCNISDKASLFWQFSLHFRNVRESCFYPPRPPWSNKKSRHISFLRDFRSPPTHKHPSSPHLTTPVHNSHWLDIDPRPVIPT